LGLKRAVVLLVSQVECGVFREGLVRDDHGLTVPFPGHNSSYNSGVIVGSAGIIVTFVISCALYRYYFNVDGVCFQMKWE